MPRLKMKKNAHSRPFIQFVTQKSCGLKKAFLGADKGTSIPHSALVIPRASKVQDKSPNMPTSIGQRMIFAFLFLHPHFLTLFNLAYSENYFDTFYKCSLKGKC